MSDKKDNLDLAAEVLEGLDFGDESEIQSELLGELEANSEDEGFESYDPLKKLEWFLLTTPRSKEEHAKKEIEQVIEDNNLQADFGEIFIPMQTQMQVRKGKVKKVEKKMFPGNLFVEMFMNKHNYNLIRTLKNVTGFTGNTTGQRPSTVKLHEIKAIKEAIERIQKEFDIEPGCKVTINDESYNSVEGTVISVDDVSETAQVEITMLGRPTTVSVKIRKLKAIV